MVKRFFALALSLLFAGLTLTGCGTQTMSAPERGAAFTRHVLSQDACPYGTIEGSVDMGTSVDSSYEYTNSTRRGVDERLRFRQRGYSDAKCAPKPQAAPLKMTPTLKSVPAPKSAKPGAKK